MEFLTIPLINLDVLDNFMDVNTVICDVAETLAITLINLDVLDIFLLCETSIWVFTKTLTIDQRCYLIKCSFVFYTTGL